MEDQMVLMIIMTVTILVFVLIGLLFINGKGDWLIAGYNTMPAEQKDTYDTPALLKFMGKTMFALAFWMVWWMVSVLSGLDWIFAVSLVLFIGTVAFSIIYINTGNRFKK